MKRLFLLFCLIIPVLLSAQTVEKELGKLYSQKSFALLREQAAPVLKAQPENALVNLLVGRSYVDQNLNAKGKPFILNAIKYDDKNSWIKGWGILYLSQIEFVEGDITAARKHLQNCISLNSTQNLKKSATGLMLLTGLDDFYNNWISIETENFRFKFQPQSVVRNPNEFAKIREDALKQINSIFKVKLPKKIEFIVWNSLADAKKIGTKQLSVVRPKYSVVHVKYDAQPGHEITHILSYFLDNQQYKSRFINEGVSVAFDLDPSNKLEQAKEIKAKAQSDINVSIKEAWEDPSVYPAWVYYSLAGELISRLLKEGGPEKLVKLITNQKYEVALELYGPSLSRIIADLEKEIN